MSVTIITAQVTLALPTTSSIPLDEIEAARALVTARLNTAFDTLIEEIEIVDICLPAVLTEVLE